MVLKDLRVLFVYNSKGIDARTLLVTTQGRSLMNKGVHIDYYDICSKNVFGYIKHVKHLKNYIKRGQYDIVHSKFGFSAFTSTLAGAKPHVVSLMGSDYKLERASLYISKLFARFFWDVTIAKSPLMYNALKGQNTVMIPNGIDFSRFKHIDREIARKRVDFSSSAHVLWVSDPERKEKNFDLAREGFANLNTNDVELTVVNNVELDKVPFYYYAADVLLVTSKWEGSPNVVKEAMACSLPIVSTDVGDITNITEGTTGCYIVESDPESIAMAIDTALSFGKRTNGRDKVRNLDVDNISDQMIEIYLKLVDK